MSELVSDHAGGTSEPSSAAAESREAEAPAPPAVEERLPSWVPTLALVGVVAFGTVFRFVTRSNLWLDEALSVNIASLDVGDLLEALRHDGHPPLYYLLLHYWMSLVGEGDFAIRVLSGIFAVGSMPLAWIAGRRLAGVTGARWALALVALSPFWIRYASEARMYSLVMLLVLAGYLLVYDALRRPELLRLAAVALVSGLLLLAHYWSFWLLGAVMVTFAWRGWRRPEKRRTTAKVAASIAVGGLLFLPWLPSFFYQATHTGTPWAGPMRPLQIAEVTLRDLGGGGLLNESFFYAVGIFLMCLAALFVVRGDGPNLSLDLRTVPGARVELAVIGLTIAIGCVTAYLSSSTFQSRYAAVFVPLLYLVVVVGLTRLPAIARLAVGGTLVVMSVLGVGWYLYFQRTQSGDIASAVSDHAQPGDVVVYCPDQLGPAFSREMPEGLVELAYPVLDSPERVDWVDYGDRNAAADAESIAAEVAERAGGQSIFVVWKGSYATFDEQCEELVGQLSAERPMELLVGEDPGRYYEPANLHWLAP